MRLSILTSLLILVSVARSEDTNHTETDRTAPVSGYVEALLTNDLEAFKKVHSTYALAAYEKAGGIDKIFPELRAQLVKKHKGVALSDFTFTASSERYAVREGLPELDGDYYMVSFLSKTTGGGGMLVELEDSHWKVTIARFKNLAEFMKKASVPQKAIPNKAPQSPAEDQP